MANETRWFLGVDGGERELNFLKTIDGLTRIESNNVVPAFEHKVKLFLGIPNANDLIDVHSIEKLANDFLLQIRGLFELCRISTRCSTLAYSGLFEKKGDLFHARFPVYAQKVDVSGCTNPKRFIECVLKMLSDKDIQDVLVFLGCAHVCWNELSKVFEICKRCMTDVELSHCFGSKKTQGRFTLTSNHDGSVAGRDARHARFNKELPKKPMQLDEARNYILTGVIRWLHLKKKIDD
ncbi:MAG: hypothetical protein ABL888_05390 [Pirellulaceae bacterium]